MKTIMTIGAVWLTALITGAAAQEPTDRQIARMPASPTISAERAAALLDAAGVSDPIVRRWLAASLVQESAENASGRLPPGSTLVVPFDVKLATATAKPESQQWRFAVSYTRTTDIVEGAVFCRGDRGRWSR